jgi:hypothetical protein
MWRYRINDAARRRSRLMHHPRLADNDNLLDSAM